MTNSSGLTFSWKVIEPQKMISRSGGILL